MTEALALILIGGGITFAGFICAGVWALFRVLSLIDANPNKCGDCDRDS